MAAKPRSARANRAPHGDFTVWKPGQYGTALSHAIGAVTVARAGGDKAVLAEAQTKLTDLIVGEHERAVSLVRVDETLARALAGALGGNEEQFQRVADSASGRELTDAMTSWHSYTRERVEAHSRTSDAAASATRAQREGAGGRQAAAKSDEEPGGRRGEGPSDGVRVAHRSPGRDASASRDAAGPDAAAASRSRGPGSATPRPAPGAATTRDPAPAHDGFPGR